MEVNYFTDEQVATLSPNPYMDKASHKEITYSKGFKQHFINERKNEKFSTENFRTAGLDPTILGQERIKEFASRVRKIDESLRIA